MSPPSSASTPLRPAFTCPRSLAGYLITQIPGGILADKYQPKYILLVCTVLGGLMTGAMALLKSYEMGLVIRVVTGISAGCVMAQCSKIVAITFAPQQRRGGPWASSWPRPPSASPSPSPSALR